MLSIVNDVSAILVANTTYKQLFIIEVLSINFQNIIKIYLGIFALIK